MYLNKTFKWSWFGREHSYNVHLTTEHKLGVKPFTKAQLEVITKAGLLDWNIGASHYLPLTPEQRGLVNRLFRDL